MYGKVCQHWGVDPGAPFGDDVIAFNVRSALLVSMAAAKAKIEPEAAEPPEYAEHTQGRIVTDLEQQMEAYVLEHR